ncbi:unnamed protein product [Taenia asiatica]|uniref:Ion_trans_2 domain-containing protein n=1 Tax=Taenia asiatica TaxID=60517 RepID=A0A158R8L0_TAEAS|nr:unnamed protein product [Taenia asiatica]
MESYSSDFAMKNIVVVNNTSQNALPKRRQCYRLCGQTCSKLSLSASEKAKKYFSRFYKFKQMDFEYASWQMVNIFVSPQKLYRNFSYHHSTRNQWARDDPAFMILFIPWMFGTQSICCNPFLPVIRSESDISTTIYSAILGHSFWGWLKLLLWSLTFECILSGLLVATCMWIIANHWMLGAEHANNSGYTLRRQFSNTSDDESVGSDSSHLHTSDVEWAYAFDIHLNALFPCIIILRIIQPMFLYFLCQVVGLSFFKALLLFFIVIRRPTFVGSFIGNSFWLAGILYYVYITFLGYKGEHFAVPIVQQTHYEIIVVKALPFLRHTRGILLAGTLFIILYITSVALGWNFTSYWTHVKELLPRLKCLDNITTESTRAQRDAQNECDFDDEWAYINRVIDEFVYAPYKVSIESDFEKKTSAIGTQKSSGNSSLFSLNKPISLIYLTPDEKRQRAQIDEDGTIRDRSDSKEIRKWAESLPKMKPVSTNLTSGSIICGNIGKALRQRRTSICTPIPSNSNDTKKAKPAAECEKEGIDFDGETEATIIEGLQNECKNIMDELERWRAKFLCTPRKYTTPSFRIPRENNANCLESFTSRERQKTRALANVKQPTSMTTQLKGLNSNQLTNDSKYPDAESQITHIELERVKLRPVLRGKPGRAQSEVPRCKPPPPNEANFPPSRKTLVSNSLQKRPMKDSTQRPNLATKPGVQAQRTLISLKPC